MMARNVSIETGKQVTTTTLSWVTLPVISVTTPTALDSFQTDQ